MKTRNARLKYSILLTKNISALLITLFVGIASFSQEGIYKNMDDALANKDEVKELKLQGKKYFQVPEELLEFENLEVLSLKKNKIDSLPDWFSDLPISELNLAKNKFKTIPKEIFEMPLLEYLDLSENEIEILEGDFDMLRSLKVLELWGNLFEDIPYEMTQIPQLIKLDLRLIEFNRFKQQEILEMFPEVKVYMSPPCNCK